MKKSDAIIHFIKAVKKYQWLYCTKDQDETKVEFEAGKLEGITSANTFDSKEDAIVNLNKYIKQHNLEAPNRIMFGEA